MNEGKDFKFATRAIHAGQTPDPSCGAIMTPVFQTSTFVQTSPGEHQGYEYARTGNPTRTALEANLAALENGQYGICFASGCASLDAVLRLFKSGDHVIVSDDVYGGTFRVFDQIFKPFGLQFSMVDLTKSEALEQAFNTNTKLVWLETPSNPLMKVIDIKAVAEVTHSHSALLCADNTFATPFLQRPLDDGADIISHSCTKYLGGHSDFVGGALVVNDAELADRLHYIQNAVGAVPAPWDCFLTLRSTKTLHLRMERHCQNAMQVAQFLEGHAAIEQVLYPGLPSHPQHELAARQMDDFGGMVTATLQGGFANTKRFLERLRVFAVAESLGGVESLINHPAIMTHASIPPDIRAEIGITDNLVRFSVGIEDVDDLLADIVQAVSP